MRSHDLVATPRCAALLLVAGILVLTSQGSAQPAIPPSPGPEPAGPEPPADDGDWSGAVRVLRVPGDAGGSAEAKAAAEIFPDAGEVHMHVHGTDPRPVEAARRGVREWICSGGCELSEGEGPAKRQAQPAPDLLRSIKVQTPTMPLPLTIWRPSGAQDSGADTSGNLMFDPVLLGRRSYDHVCAYPPVKGSPKVSSVEDIPLCTTGRAEVPPPDAAEMLLGFRWPATTELADFQYLAIVDTCGNARVMPFRRSFAVPVFHVASGGCGKPDGQILRVFPSGGWVRVTAFNLDAPATGSVVSATFRVTVPPLEDLVSADTPPLLFPDPDPDDLVIDCGPLVRKARRGPGGIPRRPGDPISGKKSLPGQKPPPGQSLPGQKPPPGKSPPEPAAGEPPPEGGKIPPGESGNGPDKNAPGVEEPNEPKKSPPIVRPHRVLPASTPEGQPMVHQALVLSPKPLWRGNCRLELKGQTKRRLVAPLALHVRVTRTDKVLAEPQIHQATWVVTPSDSIYRLPPIAADAMDGESRLRIEVYSDPLSPQGNVVLLSDAARLARVENAGTTRPAPTPRQLERLVGSVTVHTAPLCGESNFETVEGAGSCLRGYLTVPAMLATLQVTRAPWVERPLITRNILSAVGVAFAFDSYDPVERQAFPIAGHVGGFIQDLDDDRLGFLAYLGVAPTIPILGEGGNTTSVGLLGGLGIEYITRTNGPDEGFKPAAFLSAIVQVGQVTPTAQTPSAAFGTYQPPAAPGLTK